MEKNLKVTNDWNLIDMADILHRSVMIKSGKLYSSFVAIDIPVHQRIIEEENENDLSQSLPDDHLSSIDNESKSNTDEDLCRCECDSLNSDGNKLFSFCSEDICLIDDSTVNDQSPFGNHMLLNAASHDSLELLAKSYAQNLASMSDDCVNVDSNVVDKYDVSNIKLVNTSSPITPTDRKSDHSSDAPGREKLQREKLNPTVVEEVFISSMSSSSASHFDGNTHEYKNDQPVEVSNIIIVFKSLFFAMSIELSNVL